jgi:hypothetical protein
MRGKEPEWRWNIKNGKLSREKCKSSIDWYRHQQEIITPKIIPSAKRCQISRPDAIVQEDGAPSRRYMHKHEFTTSIRSNRYYGVATI